MQSWFSPHKQVVFNLRFVFFWLLYDIWWDRGEYQLNKEIRVSYPKHCHDEGLRESADSSLSHWKCVVTGQRQSFLFFFSNICKPVGVEHGWSCINITSESLLVWKRLCYTGDLLCFSFLQFALNPWSLQNHQLVILVYWPSNSCDLMGMIEDITQNSGVRISFMLETFRLGLRGRDWEKNDRSSVATRPCKAGSRVYNSTGCYNVYLAYIYF